MTLEMTNDHSDLTLSDPDRYVELDRTYDETEAKEKAVILSIVRGIQDLVLSTTDDPQELHRCDEICDAIIAFTLMARREPLQPHEDARAAWRAAHDDETTDEASEVTE